MIRDIIDCLMAGGLLSFLPIWTSMTVLEQLTVAAGIAVICYIILLFIKLLIELLIKKVGYMKKDEITDTKLKRIP